MIIVFLDKPRADNTVSAHVYKDMAELSKEINKGIFGLEGDDSIFVGEMPVLKEYVYTATLVEKKSKK